MVNIFGFKLFESPSIDEQMHHKSRRHRRNFKHRSRRHRRHFNGGYMYDDTMTAETSSIIMSNPDSNSKTNSKSKSRYSSNKKRKTSLKGKGSKTRGDK